MTTTYITLSAAKIRQYVEVTQVGFDVDWTDDFDGDRAEFPGYDAKHVDGVSYYDAGTVACDTDDADEVESALQEAGFEVTRRRPIYAVSGPEGDVLHEVKADAE